MASNGVSTFTNVGIASYKKINEMERFATYVDFFARVKTDAPHTGPTE